MDEVLIVGGGLAGCECAWQLAERGSHVVIREQRPIARSPAHNTDHLAELVCSNSLRGASISNAIGLLKEELRRCGSLVMRAADDSRVPAGGALAVDRTRFSAIMTEAIERHPNIRVERCPVDAVPDARPCVIATGPLTSDALAADLASRLGEASLSYFDAIAPIVASESIDWGSVFRQSRFDKADLGSDADAVAYVNCPFDEAGYKAFVAALRDAEKLTPPDFDKIPYFEGCLPIEVMAERGEMTLAFGPMKPVGLTDPKTGRRPFAVVQLRAEDRGETAFNLVGFQTRMTHESQRQVLRMIPGLENAAFMRLGAMHRNTFVDAPRVLDETAQLRALPGVYLAGQLTGVEGYVESTACGLACGRMLADRLAGHEARVPPRTTAIGALLGHLKREQRPFQPSNITWAHFEPLQGRVRKNERKAVMAERALQALEGWR
ncbi:MAG: methylenetetrahydrofolate--tRNA-(uracil(54)-C(5))-methyltransferase (FADH(2)-oxidizing) TrmFO [Deltaproteobacteria bacterium]|nr:methylenetetrahydrofolate--tRNA-(uracil(54)-C(5))-methyltransferase (FADH(2)-oxidizing) TrmFO [Deltaproteobacteria bacterium]